MSGKMTDEVLDHRLKQYGYFTNPVREAELRAHISALTAELDEKNTDLQAQTTLTLNAHVERDALRERVKTLEARDKHLVEAATNLATERDNIASALAAIRQRAGDEASLLRRAEVGAIMGAGSSEWDEDIHAEVAQRGDVDTLHGAALAVARYILGDDATGPSETPAERVARMCAMHDARIVGGMDAGPEQEPRPCDVQREAPEPTTAEAFATLRHANEHGGWSGEAVDALSLLELRMGELEALLDSVNAGWAGAALTDAPSVFTLEEIRKAFRETYIGATTDDLLRNMVERLAALRRTP
jgi:hypothetical protein